MSVYDERRVKIVATLGPASRSPETLRELFDAGLDVVRINAAHGSPDDRARLVDDVRSVSEEAGRLAATGHAAAAGRTAGHVNRLARYIDRRRTEEGIA